MRLLFIVIIFLAYISNDLNAQPRQNQLNGEWKARRAMDVLDDGSRITTPGYQLTGWMDAIVPGTILTTLLHNNQVPDPFFGMNNAKIADVFNTGRDYYTYWFCREFVLPELKPGEQAWLSFRGINYYADIYLNGKRVNTEMHRGMYLREKYLVTPFLLNGKTNKLAVWVAPPDPVGNPNNGQGGDGTIARNVTMQCTAGWDWICSVPDRNTGIWDQVSLEITSGIDLKNPYIEYRVPGIRVPGEKQDPAWFLAKTELKNCTDKSVKGTASAEIDGHTVSLELVLQPGEEKTVTFPGIEIKNPRLWWPNGTGDHPLYPVKLKFTAADGTLSDSETVQSGIRETTNKFDQSLRSQTFYVNGQKIFIKGGNWIASDALLRLSSQRYEAEIRLHAGMNMNMIRVWGGALTERPEFYDACDKYGILVWQDLWISGDCNGEWQDPLKKDSQERRKAYPDDHNLFLASVTDQVKMLRNHPSLFLWCGGNETYPPKDILDPLAKVIFPALDPKRLFLDKSTSPMLMTNESGGTGDGPYGILEPLDMFTKRSFPFNPEIGSVGIPNFDGLKKIIPAEELRVPRTPNGSGSWNYHKYHSFQDFPDRYGKVKGIEDFCLKAQIVSYDQYRSLQEASNYKMWSWYTGMLIWKNQNPWTALRGSFYDYYLDYQGGYFGYKHGAVPLHIQLNLNDSTVCIVNQTAQKTENITARIRLFDLHGKLVSEQKEVVSQDAQSVKMLNKISLPKVSNTLFFLKLQLEDKKGVEIDENLYWLTAKIKSYDALNQLDKVKLQLGSEKFTRGSHSLTISNPGNETAFFIRIKVLDDKGLSILPVYLDDNYFTLLPGESKIIKLNFQDAFQNQSGPAKVALEGWNIEPVETSL
jgi:mannosylglycoprotein endo-beta-mannosidase